MLKRRAVIKVIKIIAFIKVIKIIAIVSKEALKYTTVSKSFDYRRVNRKGRIQFLRPGLLASKIQGPELICSFWGPIYLPEFEQRLMG